MRSAVLVFGILAAALGIWVVGFGNLQGGLAATALLGGVLSTKGEALASLFRLACAVCAACAAGAGAAAWIGLKAAPRGASQGARDR